MSTSPLPKKKRKLANWEPSKAGRRALRDLQQMTGFNLKTAVETSIINEVGRRKGGAV